MDLMKNIFYTLMIGMIVTTTPLQVNAGGPPRFDYPPLTLIAGAFAVTFGTGVGVGYLIARIIKK